MSFRLHIIDSCLQATAAALSSCNRHLMAQCPSQGKFSSSCSTRFAKLLFSCVLIIPDFHLKRRHSGRAKSSGTHSWWGGGEERLMPTFTSLKATLWPLSFLSPLLNKRGNCLLDPVAPKPAECLVIFSLEILVQARQMPFSIISQDAQRESHRQAALSPWVGAIKVNPLASPSSL